MKNTDEMAFLRRGGDPYKKLRLGSHRPPAIEAEMVISTTFHQTLTPKEREALYNYVNNFIKLIRDEK